MLGAGLGQPEQLCTTLFMLHSFLLSTRCLSFMFLHFFFYLAVSWCQKAMFLCGSLLNVGEEFCFKKALSSDEVGLNVMLFSGDLKSCSFRLDHCPAFPGLNATCGIVCCARHKDRRFTAWFVCLLWTCDPLSAVVDKFTVTSLPVTCFTLSAESHGKCFLYSVKFYSVGMWISEQLCTDSKSSKNRSARTCLTLLEANVNFLVCWLISGVVGKCSWLSMMPFVRLQRDVWCR